MTERSRREVPEAAVPNSVPQLIAMALAMEREAAARYDELATEMVRHGNTATAELFQGLAAEEREHEASIGHWLAPGADEPPAAKFEWCSPETTDQETEQESGGVYLMTPYRALCVAVHNEERAFTFFSLIAATAKPPDICAKAETLAKEELNHVVRLRLQRRRAWPTESRSAARRYACQVPRAAESLAALHDKAYAIEHEATLTYDSLAVAMAELGDHISAKLFLNLASEERTLLATIAQRTDEPNLYVQQYAQALGQAARTAPYDTLRHALSEAEAAVDFYTAMAEQSANQDMMEKAQHFAELALVRLKRVRGRLVVITRPDREASLS